MSRASGLAVVYQQCPKCAASSVATEAGPVVVDPEWVEHLATVAHIVNITPEDVAEPESLGAGDIDPPNSATLARKVRHRDGLRCAHPGCGRRHGLQAHHIRFRSEGGRTVLNNEVTVCRRCHTLIHGGLLKVQRGEGTALEWRPCRWVPRT